MRAAVARFFTEYESAFDADINLSNKASKAFEDAFMYLAGFTLDNKGLTAEEAKKLYGLLDVYDSANGDAGEVEITKAEALKHLDLAFRRPYGAPL